MPKASIALQILPLYTEEKISLDAVDRVIEFLRKEAAHAVVGPFETTIEGDFHDLMSLLTQAIEIAGEEGAAIFANAKIRYHKERQMLSSDDKTKKYH
ncbi:thiamine-binding protein [Fundicoccus sp. Sow4_H7]|uniref:thiamine-binding protein n=1 Tax=Fundicoccus sp. Sow4_H7 TaxID=3438784 RepID=UPI003F91EB07